MRLFTAITIPEHVKTKLQKLLTPIEGVKWQNKSQMHLTLRFIGEVNSGTANRLIDELEEVAVSPFEITVDQLGTFPERGKSKVIWIGVMPNENLLDLHAQLETACQNAGLEADNRPYKPHITLGRNKSDSTNEIRRYIERQTVPDFKPISVSEFCLIRSELTPKGAIYHTEKRFPLS